MLATLIDIIRKRFLDTIRSVNPPGKWKILVVDDYSQRLLGGVLRTYDILEENVTLIETVNSIRTPQPQFEAIYMLMPTTQNVERIIGDFTNGRQQYAGANIFFIDGLPDPLLQRLGNSPAGPFLKCVVDLYLNIHAIEAQAFSLKDPSLFFSFFSPPKSASQARAARERVEEDLRFASKCIMNVCITLGEYPLIRYYLPSHHSPLGALGPVASPKLSASQNEAASRWRSNLRAQEQTQHANGESTTDAGDFISRRLAFMVQQEFDEYRRLNPDFPTPSDPPRPRGVLFITDRSMDIIAPFLHEFTYQAMCNDLLPIEDGTKYRYKFQSSKGEYEDKTAILSDADTVWTQIRHMHMRETIDKLMADFNKFLQENAVFKGETAGNINDMKDMLANLPQYQEQREKFSLHLNMAQECMDLFEKKKLPSTANVEQNCATGVTAEGKTPKTLVEEMVPLLDDRSLSNRDKVRIIALYILHRDGVPDEDRRRLFQHARLSLADQDAVNSLVHLGVRVTRTPGDRDTRKPLKPRKSSSEDEYELSRYQPLIRTVLEDQAVNRLDASVFPYVRDAPNSGPTTSTLRPSAAPSSTSLRSARPGWHKAGRSAGQQSDVRQRLLVFIAGGMTYSEMRTAYQLSGTLGKDIYIGSTHTIAPERFVDDLKVIEIEGVGSAAVPNGLPSAPAPSSSPHPRSYQQMYDKRYYIKDAPLSQALSAPILQEKTSRNLGPPKASPAMSSVSLKNSNVLRKEKEEKEKKKGLFHF